MNIKFYVVYFVLFFTVFNVVTATSHYTFEHAEEMRVSGRIEWRDYGQEAFQEAIDENKPIFLMLTAPSWCYWCHVYTSDDYVYHPSVYPIINKKFIPIYVDADKRQDLTRQFLEGGWPSTTIMSPDRERLFGYSGPRPVEWMVANFQQAVDFVNSRGFSDKVLYSYSKSKQKIPTNSELNNAINGYAGSILGSYDSTYGGFGTGQKFPQGRALDFSLELYELSKDNRFIELVENTLRNQYTKIKEIETNYNLFDPVEGGFHRYGTRRDWTPPHYEKMLYDNARLLKAYFHLLQLKPDDRIVKEVVEKTLLFIEENWYDNEKGGFYGNSDVHGEDHYYGKADRPEEKPRVEKTKYSDWNSDAILTYLYLFETTNDEKYKSIAENSLNFFADEMVTDTGAFHYAKLDGTKGVRGTLLDNSYLMLAFVQGYETLGNKKYLDAANKLAGYSLENLYDWYGGGFFERNSPDKELYAPGENINLGKPASENGIITYALLKLYLEEKNPLYLGAALKTLGVHIGSVNSLDRGYYHIKSAQLVIQNNLLADYENLKNQIDNLEKEKQESFWLNELIENQITQDFELSEEGLEKLQAPLLILILIAFIAGFISFASPCTLPILPAYIAYAFKSSKHNIKGMTFAFFLGLSIVFTLLGMSATFVGQILRSKITLFSQVAGVAILLFGVYMIFGKGFSGFKIKKEKPSSYLGSFFLGTVFGISWSPCVGPILVAILFLASTTNSVFSGGLLLFVYALGLALPLIFVSIYLEKIDKKSRVWKIVEGKELRFNIFKKKFIIHSSSLISGILFIILGYLIFSGILFAFNQYIAVTSFQKYIYGIEDWILGLV